METADRRIHNRCHAYHEFVYIPILKHLTSEKQKKIETTEHEMTSICSITPLHRQIHQK